MRNAILPVLLALPALHAQDKSKPWYAMDYGPCLATTVQGWSGDNVAEKGRAIFLGDDAGVLFDTELLRIAAAWTGGYLKMRGTPFDGAHGPVPSIEGRKLLMTTRAPGVSSDGKFDDMRSIPHGPMPRAVGRFHGHYIHGDDVVLHYDIAGREVHEAFQAVRVDGKATGMARTLRFGAGDTVMVTLLEMPNAAMTRTSLDTFPGGLSVAWKDGDKGMMTSIEVVDGKSGSIAVENGRAVLTMPKAGAAQEVRIRFATFAQGSDPAMAKLGPKPDFAKLTKGGPRRYPEELKTKGKLGSGSGAWVVDTITVPKNNPWKSRLRFGAFDFVDADTAALSTWNGDVWLCDGIDGDLDELTWTRFATGLHDPLGLKVVDGVIMTHGRDGLHKLHDLNDDGECDYVEVFNNDVYITKSFHEFAFDLQQDNEGNFYFSKGGPVRPGGRGFDKIVPHHGTIMKVSKDGSKLEVVATGLRAPNGIGVSPDGVLSSGDNQGTWMPACRLNSSKNGTFWGCVDTAHSETAPNTYDEPICWLPMSVDNSGGGQVYVANDKWGIAKGTMLHQSYGMCAVYNVLQQELNGKVQGGVVRIPVDFESSQMRGRFHSGDGQLYVCGFKGWQTRAAKQTAFQRVRYTGKPTRMPTEMDVHQNGIKLTFNEALDREVAEDPESYEVEIWNYKWSQAYGSPEFAPSSPDKQVKGGAKNRDALTVKAAKLSDDGKSVWLEIDGIIEVMQMRVGYSVDGADGELVEGEIYSTVHFMAPRHGGTR